MARPEIRFSCRMCGKLTGPICGFGGFVEVAACNLPSLICYGWYDVREDGTAICNECAKTCGEPILGDRVSPDGRRYYMAYIREESCPQTVFQVLPCKPHEYCGTPMHVRVPKGNGRDLSAATEIAEEVLGGHVSNICESGDFYCFVYQVVYQKEE